MRNCFNQFQVLESREHIDLGVNIIKLNSKENIEGIEQDQVSQQIDEWTVKDTVFQTIQEEIKEETIRCGVEIEEKRPSRRAGIASATSNSSLVDMHPPRQGNTICCCLKTPSAEHSMYGLQGYKLPPHVATSLQGSSIKHLYSLSNFPKKHESNSLFYDNITKLKLNLLSLMNCTVHEC